MKLEGRIALVTGASRGIGRDIALALARAGADVACNATRAENAAETVAAVEALGRRALAVGARVEAAWEVDVMFARAEEALGPVDILVSNAGIVAPRPILEMDEEAWDRVLDVNAKGVFLCAQRAARAMVEQGRGGAIVNVGSIAGDNAFPGRINYCAAKAAVHHMTRVMACEWAGAGIRVNCVAPGYIRTDIVEDLSARGVLDVEGLQGRVPQRRLGQPRDIGEAVVFLAGAEAGYITGTVLFVDGGWDAYGYI